MIIYCSEIDALENSLYNITSQVLLKLLVNQRDSMPAGVDWFPYLRVALASFFSAAAGAQVVHMYYKPDLSIPDTPPEKGELPKLRKMQQRGNGEEQHKEDGDKKESQESSSEDGSVKKEDKTSAVS